MVEGELINVPSIDDLLIRNRVAAFLIKVSSDSMKGAGILPGDMVVLDRGRKPESGDIVIAEANGQWTMKYFQRSGESFTLVAANPKYQPIKLKTDLKIAGVVTAVVRKYN